MANNTNGRSQSNLTMVYFDHSFEITLLEERDQPKLTMAFIDHDLDAPSLVEHIQSHIEVELGVASHQNGNPSADSPSFDVIASSNPPTNSQITKYTNDFRQQMPSTATNDLDCGAETGVSDGNPSDPDKSIRDDGNFSEGGDSSEDVNLGEDADSSDSPGTRPSLFCLPIEIRTMIWKLALPGRRVFQARAWYCPVSFSNIHTLPPPIKSLSSDANRWVFRVTPWYMGHAHEVPIILKICHESRNFALQHGGFAFRNDFYSEAGLWWNPDLDALFFDYDWRIGMDTWALQGLSGLENVKHISIHSDQAAYLCYEIGYRDGAPWGRSRRRKQDVLALQLSFRESVDMPHYIPEFFPCFKSLSIRFMDLQETVTRWALTNVPPTEGANEWYEECCTITLSLGEDIGTAYEKLARYRELCNIDLAMGIPRRIEVDEDFEDADIHVRFGPVYALRHGVDIGNIRPASWMGIGFDMCRADDPECL